MPGVTTQLRNLSLGYPPLTLFSGLSMTIEAGAILAVLGANGTGKSTFAKALLGLVRPLAGEIDWPAGRPPQIGYLSQMSEFDHRFPLRVRDLVASGAWRSFALWSGLDGSARLRVASALEETGIANLADEPLHVLSVGQLQRALFARVIVQNAPLILLDEPFAGVDQSTEEHLLAIIERWRDEDRAVVLIVHDLSSVLDRCDRVLLLGAGLASSGSVAAVLTPERLVAQSYLSQSQAAWLFHPSTTRAVSNGA